MSARQKCVTALCQLLQTRGYQTTSNSSSSSSLAKKCQQWLAQSFSGHANSSTPCAGLYQSARQQLQLQLSRGFAAGGPRQPPRAPARPAQTPPGGPAAAGGAAAAGSQAAAGAAGASATVAGGAAAELSPFEQWRQKWQRVPKVPKWLGLTGAIPFIALAPPVCKHLEWALPSTVAENCAMIQVCYGVVIVTFLGAVHWGVAMATPLTSHIAVRLANEGFVYSVIPSLVAWPVALMDPGAGSLCLSLLLPACYLADYTRRNLGLPAWYMTLRVPLTFMATFGMLLTATRSVYLWSDNVREAQQKQAGQGSS